MNRKQKKDRRKEVAKIIVKSIGMAALVAGVIIFPGLAHVASWIEKSVNESSPRVRHSYNRMKKRGTIKIVLKDGKFRLLLTKKGQKQFDKYRLEDLKIEKQKVWDNKWRLVMFDIPEAFQASRKSVRDKLITLGFVQVQKSVYLHPYPCREAVEFLRSHYRLRPGELYIFEAKVLEGEKSLRKHFKL